MQAGKVEEIEPGLRRIVAPNPSPLTGTGTNSWVIGTGEVVLIDPGPDDPAHLAALLAALKGERLGAILVTHAHRDHAGLARGLSSATGAPVLAFGGAGSGLSPIMRALAAKGLAGGGEGVEAGFAPDTPLADGALLRLAGQELRAIHTPGHMGGHLCFAWGDALFSGDHVMGWSTTLVSPPEGDMGAYVASLGRLAAERWRVFHPGHGEAVSDPAARLAALIAHRRAREASILAALSAGPATAAALMARIYTDTPASLHLAAERNVFAHLIDLAERKRVAAEPELAPSALYRLL